MLRLNNSKYSSYFVLKGGLYLSSLLGINNRSTLDIDFSFQKMSLEHNKIINIIKEICDEEVNDNVIFKYLGDNEIKKEDEYEGYSIKIEGKLENVTKIFSIDVATGDKIYPGIIKYNYECLVTKEILIINGYPLESVISEKIETFLSKSVYNSRTKDLYDLFVLNKLYKSDLKSLKEAFKKTCETRNFKSTKEGALKILKLVKNDINQRKRWDAYLKKNKYAQGIEYGDLFNSIEDLINKIYEN